MLAFILLVENSILLLEDDKSDSYWSSLFLNRKQKDQVVPDRIYAYKMKKDNRFLSTRAVIPFQEVNS